MLKQEQMASLPQGDVRAILSRLIKKIEPVDFRELVTASGAELRDRLTRPQYQVFVVDRLLAIAKENEWGLAMNNGSVYVYNGQYWLSIDKQKFQFFLGKVAIKMGVPRTEASYYQFQEQLLKQFFAAANLSLPIKDRNRVRINLQNGTYEVSQDGNFLGDFRREHFLTYQLPFHYDAQATAPLFRQYLERVLPEQELQDVLAEFIGFVFAKGLKLEKCLLLYGSGANGKSVFFEIMNALLGPDNVSNFSLSNLAEEHNRAYIGDKLLNYGSEINTKIDGDTFKQLVSGEPIQCRLKHGNSFFITDYARLMFNCNELPNQVQHNEAYFRRFIIVPFGVTIPVEERDPELADRIIENELSGVFNWILEGIDRLLANKAFSKSEIAAQALEEYKKESDTVQCFLDEGDKYERDNSAFSEFLYVFQDYQKFCKDSGVFPIQRNKFKKRMERCGCPSTRHGKRGIGFRLRAIR